MKKSLIVCSLLFTMNATDIQNEIKLAKVGNWKGHAKGSFELTIEDLNQIKENFDNSEIDAVIDLDHATVYYGTGEAYGWIKELEIKDEELWAKVQWLDHGKELIKSGKYKYISPVLNPNSNDSVSGDNIGWTLHSAAITNRPFLEDLGEVIVNNKQTTTGEEKVGDDKKTQEELEQENKDLKKEIEDSKNEKIESKVNTAIAANKISSDQKDALIAMGKADYTSFEKFLNEAKPMVQQPENNMFVNNNNNLNQENKFDVLQLGGFNK